jgi:tetratricopeptide (TPR) repeat protein
VKPADANPLLQALTWHAQGQYRKAWTLYERLAPSQHQNPLYWLALTLLSLQTGESQLAPDCLQHFQRLAPTSTQQWASWHRLPLALWADGLGHWRRLDLSLLQALDGQRPPAGIHPYFELLLKLLLWPTEQATVAAQHIVAQSLPDDTPWAALAQAEAWCYLRHQHMHAEPQALSSLIGLLQQEIAVQLQPVAKANALDLQARLLLQQGELTAAQAAFSESVVYDPTPLRQLQLALCHLPFSQEGLPQQVHEINATYHRLEEALQRFLATSSPIPIAQVVTEARHGIFTLFDWNYTHAQDARLRQWHGACFAGWDTPPKASRPLNGLGIVVTPGQEGMFYFSHQTLLRPLSERVNIHLIVFKPHAIWDELKQRAPRLQIHYCSGDFGHRHEGNPFMKQWEAVRQWGLQWVYYWEVGTDTLSFLLPYFRLAPVQFTSWGSVSSSGHPAMDAFLTTALLSPPGAETDALFQERCVYLPQLPVGFLPDRLLTPPETQTRPNHCRIGCLHTPRKNSPAFLAALKGILSRHRQRHSEISPDISPDICIEVVMIESPNPRWQAAFALAVAEALGEDASAVTWLPRLSPDAFIQQMQSMDFLLDAFPFGGGKLAYDSLLCAVPLVSLRGEQLRGRIPFAFYTELDIYDTHFSAVTDVESYIDQACDLIYQPALRAQIRERILKGRERLVHRPLAEDFVVALQSMLTLQRSP